MQSVAGLADDDDRTYRSSSSQDGPAGYTLSTTASSALPKSDSYSNLFDTSSQDLPLGGSAHSLRNQLNSSSDSPSLTKRLLSSQSSIKLKAPYVAEDYRCPPARGAVDSPSGGLRNTLASDEKYPVAGSLIRDTAPMGEHHYGDSNRYHGDMQSRATSPPNRALLLSGARTSPVATNPRSLISPSSR